MTNESMSTQRSEGIPATAAERLSLAERFSSFAEYAVSTAALPQTAATSLDVARFHAFTGELTFAVAPAVRLYLDGGSVYHAERDGDPPVSRVLIDAGVIDTVQLQRGVVSVGDVAHLGRLFDRDATVDRDAVMVVLEEATNALVQKIANSVIATVTVSAYRHHPSGIHRWFVAPAESTAIRRPASGVMQVDRSVVEELPRLGAPPSPPAASAGSTQTAAASMSIEWAHPDPSGLAPSDPENEHPPQPPVAATDADIQAELDRFDADRADWTAASGGNFPDEFEDVASPLGEFRIVWPDGTLDDTLVAPEEPTSPDQPAFDEPVVLDPPMQAAPELRAPDLAPPAAPVDEPARLPTPRPGASVTSALGFTIEPLKVDRIPEPDAAVPDDVAAAVRRALRAIESAAERPADTSVPELQIAPVMLPERVQPNPVAPLAREIAQPAAPIPAPEPRAPAAPPSPLPPAAPLGFAPPTMDMRAEAVYERQVLETTDDLTVIAQTIVEDAEVSNPDPGQAPVVLDAEDDDGKRERRGALRRLIGSLRSKD